MTTYYDATNAKRAAWAEAAIHVFSKLTGCDREDALGDLLCDLMHWSAHERFDFDAALSRAQSHFQDECAEEEAMALTACAYDLAEALQAIKRLAERRDGGAAPYTVLDLIEQTAKSALAKAKGGAA